jgi:hypothetical protein
VVVSDSLGNFIEPELLLSLVVSPSLKDHVVCTNALSNSVEGKLRDNVEWSIDVETKFFVKSLGLSFFSLVKIDDFPFLVESISLSVNNDRCSFFILGIRDIEVLSILDIDKSINFILEDLEPLRIGAPDLHVLCST